MKNYVLSISLILLGLFFAQAQIINKGTLKIESGTEVSFGEDYTNDTAATHTNEGNLHLKADFTNNGTISTPSSGTTYFDSTTNVTQTIDGSAKEINFYNLEVNNTTAGVQGVAVSDLTDLKVVHGIALTSGKLRLIDKAQLVQTHTGISANTGAGLLIDQDGAENAYRYNYWSSPVNDGAETYTVQNVLKDGTTPNLFSPTQVAFTNAYEGDHTTNPIKISAYWMWKYINGTIDGYNEQDWQRLFDVTPPPTAVVPTSSAFASTDPGQGYIMKGPNAAAVLADKQNYSFEGKPNDGDYTISLTANKEYLIGNPYPSALFADEFIRNNTSDLGSGNEIIDGTLYFWEHWSTDTHVYTDYGGGYASYNLTGGTLAATLYGHFTGGSGTGSITPLAYIPVGQGFVVRSETTSGGNIIFNNAQRAFVREGATSVQFGMEETDTDEDTRTTNGVTARIRLGYENDNEMHRQLLLGFTDGAATNSFDYGYDGKMISVGADDMYFRMADNGRNFPYVIQGTGAFSINDTYPLTLVITNPGTHSIMIDELENFEEPIYILDRSTNTTVNLINNNFEILLSEGVYEERFYLVFHPATTVGVGTYLNDFVSAFYADEELIIHNTNNLSITGLQVINSIGQIIYELHSDPILSNQEIRIPFNFAKAAYVLRIIGKDGKGTYKFINH